MGRSSPRRLQIRPCSVVADPYRRHAHADHGDTSPSKDRALQTHHPRPGEKSSARNGVENSQQLIRYIG